MTERLTREELEAVWRKHQGYDVPNTRHRRHCFDAGIQAAVAHIEAQDKLLEEAREALEAASVYPRPKIVRDVLQSIRERREERSA